MRSLLLLLAILRCDSFAAFVYSPGSSGSSSNLFPFGLGAGGMRYQQVYDASVFLSHGPVAITALAFEFESPLAQGGTINAQINLSTTTRAVDSLSSIFASNVGANDQVVLGPGEIPFFRTVGSPSLSVVLNLDTPFYYNPAAGNLLMDVRLNQGVSEFLDASGLTFDGSSRVAAFFPNSTTATFVDSTALITAFTGTAVPEPGTVALILTAILTFSIFGLRKNQPNRKE